MRNDGGGEMARKARRVKAPGKDAGRDIGEGCRVRMPEGM